MRIEEHYASTAGFNDHLFALLRILMFSFAPLIHNLTDKHLYIQDKTKQQLALAPTSMASCM